MIWSALFPSRAPSRSRWWKGRSARLLENVSSLDEDRILRSFMALIRATLRTSFFQQWEGAYRSYISYKFDSHSVPELPKPVPYREILVCAPRVEGIHLRFGAVARGGLRWSDRREDFRTEVLGLVKAQMVKNTVIVPVGSKGGFFVKRAPVERRPRCAAGRRHRLLPHVHQRPARHHRQPGRGQGASRRTTWCAMTPTTPTWWWLPTRARPRSPISPTRSRSSTASGWATRSPPAARTATTTRAWASRPRVPGSR